MAQNKKQAAPPQLNYRVDWIGSDDPNFVFSKFFTTGQEALDLAKKNVEAIAYKKTKVKDSTSQWQIIPTEGSKEILRAVVLKRKMREKTGMSNFVNADGTGETEVVTTSEYKTNQNIKLASMVLISGALIYAGTRKEIENKYIRYGLIGAGVLNAIFNFRSFKFNQKV